jgi:hypothetical protein
VSFFVVLTGLSISLFGQTQVASLRPHQELRWQRISPNAEQPDGPVLYQLLFSTGGTPGTVPAFDTNPRHLTNSPIVVNGGNVVIGGGNGLLINGTTGILSFANGQTFPGTGNGSVTNVATSTGLTGGPITTTGSISIANGGVGTLQMADGSVTPAKISSGAATNGQVLTANGSGGATYQTLTTANPLSLSQSSANATITGSNGGNGNGVNGISSTGTGVYGSAAGTSGLVNGAAAVLGDSQTYYGVWGSSKSSNGVVGSSSTGSGVYGITAGSSGLVNGAAAVVGDTQTYYGVWGSSKSNDGVLGTSDSGYGVVGLTNTGFAAVYGKGGKNGAYGQTLSADDSGVLGRNEAASVTPSQAAAGVFGFSVAGWGVLARGDDASHGGVSAFSQNGPGILGQTGTAAVPAAVFNNYGGGKILSGQNNTVEKFFVDGAGSINGGLMVQPNGTSANILGGFAGNVVTGGVVGAVLAGGGSTGAGKNNLVTDDYGVVGGGQGNQAGDNAGTTSDRSFVTVGGGYGNTASGYASAISGGVYGTASGFNSAISGGYGNTASNFASAIPGGYGNSASGQFSAVAGGNLNTASGDYSFVAGGNTNTASGANSFAAGYKANANMDGSIVFATGNVNPWPAYATNRFEIFATGGFCFDGNETPGVDFVCFSAFGNQLISTATGAYLSYPGGIWTNASDRNLKTGFTPIDEQAVLNKVAAMPIQQWKYKLEPDGKKHIGPMAQDFYAAFGLGDDDKHIGTIDESGVALAAIQGLNQKLEEELRQKDAQLSAQQHRIEAQQQQLEALQNEMRAIMGRLQAVEQSSASRPIVEMVASSR